MHKRSMTTQEYIDEAARLARLERCAVLRGDRAAECILQGKMAALTRQRILQFR